MSFRVNWAQESGKFELVRQKLVAELYNTLCALWDMASKTQVRNIAESFDQYAQRKSHNLSEYIDIFEAKLKKHNRSLPVEVESMRQVLTPPTDQAMPLDTHSAAFGGSSDHMFEDFLTIDDPLFYFHDVSRLNGSGEPSNETSWDGK